MSSLSLLDQLGPLEPGLLQLLTQLLQLSEQPVPLATWRDQVLARYASGPRSTRDRMGQALREAIDLAGPGATTAHLTAELVARFARRAGAAATTNGLLASLRRACGLAADSRQLNASRLKGACWRVKESGSPRARHHSRQEIARVLEALAGGVGSWEGGRLHALGAVYAYTGVRLQEALQIRIANVDLTRGFLFVGEDHTTKTEKSTAPVPCPRVLVQILGKWLPRVGSEFAFPNLGRLKPWTGGTYGKRPTDRLVAAGQAVGVKGFTPLSLRHSLATHYASWWGLSDKQIQQILRHTTPLTQKFYVHPDLINLGELVRDFSFVAAPRSARTPPARPPRDPLLHGRKTRRPPSASGDQVVAR
jgi:integrase